MGIFSRFERGMEDGIEGAADKIFDAPISPVQISKKAEKAMKREKMVGAGRQYAPTLYTVLVNPDDDQRLFGYYPTLAGETETYLAAKAQENGFTMDGQPLVRFIVDDDLKHGKFDIIAEMVSAPIIAQLRQEEMARYGLAPSGRPQQRRAGGPQQQGFAAPQGFAAQQQPYGAPQPQPAYGAPQQQGFAPQQGYGQQGYAGQTEGAFDTYPADDAAQPMGAHAQQAPQPARPSYNEPLPYVPENEIDRSIDYGEYTFNSKDFNQDDGDDAGFVPGAEGRTAYGQRNSQPFAQQQAGFGGAAGAPGAPAPRNVPNPQLFTDDAAQPVPPQMQARLVDTATGRSYALTKNRMIMGRSSASDVVVDDINASRSHAELRLEQSGAWSITDLGSTNGTYVNGQRITTRSLNEGDRISVGMTDLGFTYN